MADAFIDVQLTPDLALPYESGAEAGFTDWLAEAWAEVAAAFPGIRLDPAFGEAADALADLMDIAAMSGEAPPDPFAWFQVQCDAEDAAALLPLLAALSFVETASLRRSPVPAGAVSFGTNPRARSALHLDRAPVGIDALYAWDVAGGTGAGVRMCVVEDGWRLDHEDLVTADIRRFSTFGASEVAHGTAVLGLVLAGDNGVGTVGVAPDASGLLVTELRADGHVSIAGAIAVAGVAVGPGGVVLLEAAFQDGAIPVGAIPFESDPLIRTAIQLLTAAQITVIEPAGNAATMDLDARPDLPTLHADSPIFAASGAIMVGGANPTAGDGQPWAAQSTHGARVDCFAAFTQFDIPTSTAADAYAGFGGTSGASAIIAGLVCTLQSMAEAATGARLAPTDIRRLLRDPSLGTPTGVGQPGGVGAMPDLRAIARRFGWPRILPVAATAISDDNAFVVRIDDEDLLARDISTGLLLPIPGLPLHDFRLPGQTPAVLATLRLDPEPLLVFEALTADVAGTVRRFVWTPLSDVSTPSVPFSPPGVVAPGRDLAAARPGETTLAVAGTTPDAHLVVMLATDGDPAGLSAPMVVDPVGVYRHLSGPVLVSRLPTRLDLVAIDDGGNLRIASGVSNATIGTGWQPVRSIASPVPFDPRARPGVAVTPDGVAVIAVGADGLLYASGLGLAPLLMETPAPIGASPAFAANGPLALIAIAGNRLLAAAVGRDGLLYSSERTLSPGGSWSPLAPVDASTPVAAAGGATLVATGVNPTLFAILPDGRPCRATLAAPATWSPLRPA
jgi:hypothetical protein